MPRTTRRKPQRWRVLCRPETSVPLRRCRLDGAHSIAQAPQVDGPYTVGVTMTAWRSPTNAFMPYRSRACGYSLRTATVKTDKHYKWAAANLVHTNVEATANETVAQVRQHRGSQGLSHVASAKPGPQGTPKPLEATVGANPTYNGGSPKGKHCSMRPDCLQRRYEGEETSPVGIGRRNINDVAAKIGSTSDGRTLRGFVTDQTAQRTRVFSVESRACE